MSRLNLIVESLLKDIIEAQHAANCHAASLARQYGKRGRACGFPLPSAQIGSLEFDLKYAVTGTSGMEEKQPNHSDFSSIPEPCPVLISSWNPC